MTLFFPRTALILVATTALVSSAAWAQMPRPNFPIRQEPGAAEAQTTAPQTTAGQDETVRREDPPMPAQPEPEGVEARQLEAARRDPPPAPPPAPPPMRTFTETRATVTGRVVDAEGPAETYKVKKGDNLDAIARRMGVDLKVLAKANGLKSPYRLQPGMVLKGPRSDSKAYVVGQGDTLYAIAKRFDVSAQALASANGIKVTARLSSGRKLILPDGYRDRGAQRTQVQVTEPAETGPAPSTTFGRNRPRTPVSEPEPQAAPPERGTTTTKVSVTGKVVEFTGKASSYKVRKGDAVDSIAHDMGMTRREFADLNNLRPPYALRPGQVLKGPPQTLKAYVPVEGDTLALIAKRFGVSAKAIAAANGMKSSAPVRAGKRLTLPSGYRDRGPVRETVRTAPSVPYSPPPERPYTPPERPYTPPAYTPPPERPYTPPQPAPVTPRPYTPPAYNPPSTPPPTTSGPLSDGQISSLGRGRFQWPLRGDVLSTFGPKGTGQRNDGINIRARPGDTVRAAAAGDVVYAGDQVPGFGNLVLVKHADGWVTAYGHLARVDVKMQQKVVQGQQIGQAGETGGVSETQLHFEVRYAPSPTERARPVDPELVLGR